MKLLVGLKKIKRRFNHFSFRYLWPLLPSGLLVALIIFLGRSQLFNINKVSCHLQQHPCPLEFEKVLVSFYGQNIFKLNDDLIKDKLIEMDNSITDINISKRLPDVVNIEMSRRVSVAQLVKVDQLEFIGLESTQSATISGKVNGWYYQLDKSGEIFSQRDQSLPNLPLVMVASSFSLGIGKSAISELVAQLIGQLQGHYVSFESITILDSSTVIIKVISSAYAILDSHQSFAPQVASLQYILSKSKIGQENPAKIDLRFDKPVLTY